MGGGGGGGGGVEIKIMKQRVRISYVSGKRVINMRNYKYLRKKRDIKIAKHAIKTNTHAHNHAYTHTHARTHTHTRTRSNKRTHTHTRTHALQTNNKQTNKQANKVSYNSWFSVNP